MPPAAFLHPQNAPDPTVRAYSAPRDPLAGLRGLFLGRRKGGEGMEGDRRVVE